MSLSATGSRNAPKLVDICHLSDKKEKMTPTLLSGEIKKQEDAA